MRKRFRLFRASWRDEFQSAWRKLLERVTAHPVTPQKLAAYHTNPHRWMSIFQGHLFLLCEHIVSCFERIEVYDLMQFADRVQRNRTSPFWTSPFLKLREPFQNGVADIEITTEVPDESVPVETDANQANQRHGKDDQRAVFGPSVVLLVTCLDKLAKQQRITVFLEGLLDKVLQPAQRLLKSIVEQNASSTMPRTWWGHKLLMFYGKPRGD